MFRDVKSVLEILPIYHQRDESIRGHVFCSFLALILKKELNMRLEKLGFDLEWSQIKQDLTSLREITLDEDGNRILLRTECRGICHNAFKAVGVGLPPMIRRG